MEDCVIGRQPLSRAATPDEQRQINEVMDLVRSRDPNEFDALRPAIDPLAAALMPDFARITAAQFFDVLVCAARASEFAKPVRERVSRANCSQNVCNRRKKRYPGRLSSRYKGVDLHEGKWRARIAKDGLRTHLGCFDSEEDAARAYDAAARSLHDEFARFNFPDGTEEAA